MNYDLKLFFSIGIWTGPLNKIPILPVFWKCVALQVNTEHFLLAVSNKSFSILLCSGCAHWFCPHQEETLLQSISLLHQYLYIGETSHSYLYKNSTKSSNPRAWKCQSLVKNQNNIKLCIIKKE
jgi:hypothetical protein